MSADERPGVDGLQIDEVGLHGTPEEQEPLDQAPHVVELVDDEVHRGLGALVASEPPCALQHLEVAARHGEGRAQLVRDVGQ